MSTDVCPECDNHMWMRGHHANYDHIHAAEVLPPAKHTDSHIIRHGYAVGMGGSIPQTWVFFENLEPALVFGRAGRMSSHDIRSYGVYEAARENRFDARGRVDVTTLLVAGKSIDREGDEAEIFRRWVRGCDPESAYYESGWARSSGKRSAIR
ncbi:hypothetical protein OG589_27390 [Sphaerisporangium sp. NBC_01403]|uniref:hypothetical protein n=1 Tax=Sphaerisporangium sp. NBC_01403 TaxID=2903599 RepID=UPI00324BB48C